jgi:ABC-type branched-subunit amino acid transport system substrate-binding protein
LGQSAVLGGPAAALGTGMRTGLLAAFKEANDAGGVHGRTINLGGAKLQFGPGDNQGMGEVFLTVIQSDGSFKSVSKLTK